MLAVGLVGKPASADLRDGWQLLADLEFGEERDSFGSGVETCLCVSGVRNGFGLAALSLGDGLRVSRVSILLGGRGPE
jgi:hypothetical protein